MKANGRFFTNWSSPNIFNILSTDVKLIYKIPPRGCTQHLMLLSSHQKIRNTSSFFAVFRKRKLIPSSYFVSTNQFAVNWMWEHDRKWLRVWSLKTEDEIGWFFPENWCLIECYVRKGSGKVLVEMTSWMYLGSDIDESFLNC